MNMKIAMSLVSLVSCLPIATAQADEGLALTWKNAAGYWFACGPIQCTQAGEKTERQALDYVLDDNRHSASYRSKYGRCEMYIVEGVEAYENSGSKVKRLAKCE